MPHLMEYQSGKVRPEPPGGELRRFLAGDHATILRAITIIVQPMSGWAADHLRSVAEQLAQVAAELRALEDERGRPLAVHIREGDAMSEGPFVRIDVDAAMARARVVCDGIPGIDWEATRRNLEGMKSLCWVPADWTPGLDVLVLEGEHAGDRSPVGVGGDFGGGVPVPAPGGAAPAGGESVAGADDHEGEPAGGRAPELQVRADAGGDGEAR